MKKQDIVASLGLALFFVIYATQVWGGIFPFLPADFQTNSVTLLFYLVQNIAFVAALVASVVGSYYFPTGTKHMLVALAVVLLGTGSVCIIAAMYVPALTMVFVTAGAALLGVGTAAFFMLWQRYFSSIEPAECNQQLMMGGALAAIIYYLLYLVPRALTAFLIPIIILPLGALCLTLSIRSINFDQPMFEDIPHEHPEVYRSLARDIWRSLVGVGALGFAYGLARGIALADESTVGEVVNIASMAGLLAASLLLLGLSKIRSVRFGLVKIFRLLYPVVLTGFLLFPFFGSASLSLFTGITYLAFSAIVLVMMMQAAQISRDRGTNPVFVYGLLATAVFGLQAIGFLLGWFAPVIPGVPADPVMLLCMLAAYVMGIALYFISRPPRAGRVRHESQVELVHAGSRTTLAEADKDGKAAGAKLDLPLGDERQFRDRLSKQCLVAQGTYMLSSREAEVAELIARGRSVAQISEELFISENTVRTHSKHIYTKMDIHSKQELTALLDSMDLSVLPEG